MKARQDYLPREKLDKYLNTNPSSSLSSLVPRGMTEDELTAEFTRKFESVGVSVIFLLRYVSIEKEKTGTWYTSQGSHVRWLPCIALKQALVSSQIFFRTFIYRTPLWSRHERMGRWCPSCSCRYHCIFVNVETKIMTQDENIMIIIIIKISFFFCFF